MNGLAPFQTGLEAGFIMFFCVLGLSIAFRILDFADLTIEGSFLIGSSTFAIMSKNNVDIWLALIISAALGGLAGLLTGFIHTKFNLNKFLSAVIVVAICYTACLRIMDGSNVGLLMSAEHFDGLVPLKSLLGLHGGKIIVFAVISLIISVIFYFGLSSRVGLRCRVSGCNPIYAKALGINIVGSIMLGLFATNSLAALSGALIAVNQGFADIGLGQGVLIVALASMCLGDRLLSEAKLSILYFVIFSSAIGSLSYQLIVSFAVNLGINPVDLKLITAIIVLMLVILRSKINDDPFARA